MLASLEKSGYTTATPIQARAIPPILAGKDVLGSAQTGTGKTAAFAVPILQRLAELKSAAGTNKSVIRCLVLVPTRELALQVNTSFNKYGRSGVGGPTGIGVPMRYAVAYGGVKQGKQVEALASGVDVLVATPGRLEDLHQQGLVDLSNVAILVLDEADQMLDMGFIEPIRRIARLCPAAPPKGHRQTLLFSATMPPEIKRLAHAMLHHFVEVHVAPEVATTRLITQQAYLVKSGQKSALLKHYLAHHSPWKTLLFARTRHGADRIARQLDKLGITAAAIHGNRTQPQRQRALEAFKKDEIAVLVATDVAARGLHIPEVSHVVNFDMPAVAETYVHRIGRTGRAGATGTAVSFVLPEEAGLLREIEKHTGTTVERLITPPLEPLPAEKPPHAPQPPRSPAQPPRRPRQESPRHRHGQSSRRPGPPKPGRRKSWPSSR